MPKLEVHLKQHTPILQFHAEPGAGLRGTELKPALDRFLLQQCPGVKRWEIKNDDDRVHALEYRVKIVDTADEIPNLDERKLRQTGFFAAGLERSGDGTVAHQPMLGTGAMITFLSAHRELLECIEKWIGPFFACTNFGYRKSKGFGCYTVEAINGEPYQRAIETDIRMVLDKAKLYEVSSVRGQWVDVLGTIAQVSAIMKSGINLSPRSYDRSILMKEYGYAERKIGDNDKPSFSNEKRMMKQGIGVINRLNNQYDMGSEKEKIDFAPQQIKQDDYRFIRALLGYADQYTFRSPTGRITVNAYDAKNPAKGAFRMESPMLFKPVKVGSGWRVYIVQRKLPAEIFDREFYFSMESRNFNPGDGRTIKIRTPKVTEFELENFLDFVAAYDQPKRATDDRGNFVPLKGIYPLIKEVK